MEIRISDLSKHYVSGGKTIKALDEVNLTIPDKGIFTLLGPSGCGKTTLLRSIVGLETPDRGEIAIGGEVVWSREKNISLPTERRGLGMVFQTYAIWPHMTVFDNVAYPLQTRGTAKAEIRERVARTLRFVQLEGYESRPATRLSGGQQQRVALARALVAEPKVILFDEPLSNLDAKLREETRKELRTFLTELAITAVYVTHDRIEALALSDRIAVMNQGRIIEIGAPEKIYFDAEHRFVADFIGRANLLPATVAAQEPGRTLVDSALGRVACRPRPNLGIGDATTLCFRPEFIRLEKGPGKDAPVAGDNRFAGRVETLVFIGEAFEGEVKAGEALLFVKASPDLGLHPGDPVNVVLDPRHCMLPAA